MLKKTSRVYKLNLIAIIIIQIALSACALPFAAAAEESAADFASIAFGSSSEFINMHENYANYMTPVDRAGREGLRSAGTTGCDMWLDINDKFMHDLPNDTPIDITIEYYDEGCGHFSIHYDSYNPVSDWPGVPNNDVYKETEVVFLTDTKEWKSYTFHIEDLRASNRIYNGDIRLSTFSPSQQQSAEEVVFGSLKITYGEYSNPLKSKLSMGKVGNIMNDEDEIVLHLEAYNKDSEQPISFKISGAVYDEYNREISHADEAEYELAPHEESEYKLPLENPKKYGLYKFRGSLEVDYKSQNKTVTEECEVKFSVSHTYEPGDGNTELGSCHQLISYSMGNPEDVAEVYNKAGLTYIRDDLNKFVCSFDGIKWVINQNCIDGWKTLKDRGINTIGILFGPKNDIEGIPVTEQQLTEWEQWVRDSVTALKGIIDVYEVWNEANYWNFNKNDATPEQYAELVKRTYGVIKSINPNATVLGISTANVDYEWTERVLAAGAGDYMDAVTIHPYDWSGSFRDKLWIEEAESIHGLMDKYGIGDKPLWASEFGFSTYEGEKGYTRQEQYQNHILGRAIAKAYKIYDKYIFYCFADRAKRDEVEDNWGIVDWYQAEKDPYAAKESFIAMTAFSYFINQNSDIKQVDGGDSVYSFWFDNKKLGKDILLLQSNNYEINLAGGAKKNYKLGCSSIDLYDAYGNKIDTVSSDNGEYSFLLTAEPFYVIGNFTDFQISDYDALIEPQALDISAGVADTASLRFKKKTDKELKINVENTVDVIENIGFVDDEAEIKIKAPDKKGESYKFKVSISDSDGKVYYAAEHSIKTTSPIEITAVSEGASELNNNQWRIRVSIKNLCVSRTVKGVYKAERPEDISMINSERAFELSPQEKIVYIINIPEKVNKNVINFVSSAVLEDGYSETNSTMMNFTSASYTDKKPVIDGVIEMNEWSGSWFGADSENDVKEIKNWGGPSDLSFSGTMMWDDDNLYFLGIATDDTHYIQHGTDPLNMWSTDSFQIAVDDRMDINPVGAGRINEFGLGATPDGSSKVYRYSSYYNSGNSGVVENSEIAVKRYETYTVYEVRLPWDEIFYENYTVDYQEKEHKYRFSLLLNDNDGDGRGWIEYMSGIGGDKTVELFGDMKLNK